MSSNKKDSYWSYQVKIRDGFTCQKCGAIDNITAHHIKTKMQYPELRYEIDNGITLCFKCHAQVHYDMQEEQGVIHLAKRQNSVTMETIFFIANKKERNAPRDIKSRVYIDPINKVSLAHFPYSNGNIYITEILGQHMASFFIESKANKYCKLVTKALLNSTDIRGHYKL